MRKRTAALTKSSSESEAKDYTESSCQTDGRACAKCIFESGRIAYKARISVASSKYS